MTDMKRFDGQPRNALISEIERLELELTACTARTLRERLLSYALVVDSWRFDDTTAEQCVKLTNVVRLLREASEELASAVSEATATSR